MGRNCSLWRPQTTWFSDKLSACKCVFRRACVRCHRAICLMLTVLKNCSSQANSASTIVLYGLPFLSSNASTQEQFQTHQCKSVAIACYGKLSPLKILAIRTMKSSSKPSISWAMAAELGLDPRKFMTAEPESPHKHQRHVIVVLAACAHLVSTSTSSFIQISSCPRSGKKQTQDEASKRMWLIWDSVHKSCHGSKQIRLDRGRGR